jgi:ATP-binding cassette subfamily B multidrug efflux pump
MSQLYSKESISRKKSFRRLLGYTKPHIKPLSIAFAVLLLATIADVIGPILIKIFIDDHLTRLNYDLKLFWD